MKVKVNVTQPVKGRIGQSIVNGNAVIEEGETRPPLLLRDVIVNAIDTPQAGDEKLTTKQKLDLDKIARACLEHDQPELETTQWTHAANRIGSSGYSIQIIGEADALMSTPAEPKKSALPAP